MATCDCSIRKNTLGGLKILHLLVTQVDNARDLLVIDFLSVPTFLGVTGNSSPIIWQVLVVSFDSFMLISLLAAAFDEWSCNDVPEDSYTPETEDE